MGYNNYCNGMSPSGKVKIASGNLQGRKPDDERHRLRRGRRKFRMNFTVTWFLVPICQKL